MGIMELMGFFVQNLVLRIQCLSAGPSAPGVGEADVGVFGRRGDEAVGGDGIASGVGGDPCAGRGDDLIDVDEFGFLGLVGEKIEGIEGDAVLGDA